MSDRPHDIIEKKVIREERSVLLDNLTAITDKAMIALAFVWIGLMIGDFLGKLTPPLVILNDVIWGIFGLDFLVKFAIAPHKLAFLKTHWLLLISLVLPAFRLLRILQALSALRALSFVRILTSLNVGIGQLTSAMGRRGVGYVTVISIIVLFGGAAGMYNLENPHQLLAQGFGNVVKLGGGLHSYSDAVWWTAMLMTTIGSQYWPVTTAGRALCFLLSMFSLGVFGYITAALASFFVDKEQTADKPRRGSEESIDALRADVQTLIREVRQMRERNPSK
ncbi:MAG TPA: ion transporter [Rhizomicrobium sp.]|jgi:voltage-gated potassium channel|nr:ion transporter [Rhizomicrobium sp.]